MIYALDTNILSFLLKNNKNAVCNADAATYNGHELIIPKIVDYEIQRGLRWNQARCRKADFISSIIRAMTCSRPADVS